VIGKLCWKLQAAAILLARVLVNATGPWLPQFAARALHGNGRCRCGSMGSHIVLRRLFEHDRAYLFQSRDGRVVFAIPFEDDFTLIGDRSAFRG
jgi:glycerol-3-phosphate dehydrogenase